MPGYVIGPHHRLIAEKLDEVLAGKIRRLMIFAPPRHGKSELASRRFPAFALGQNPRRRIITATYGADLANEFGYDVRKIIAEPSYATLFPDTKLMRDRKAADRWRTEQDGQYIAVGINTSLTGRGDSLEAGAPTAAEETLERAAELEDRGRDVRLDPFHPELREAPDPDVLDLRQTGGIFPIDDPVKDKEEARSQRMRERTQGWYTSVLRTRLGPRAAIVLMMTRWHEDDLGGWLRKKAEEEGGEQWELLELAAEAWPEDPLGRKPGEYLWPAMFPPEEYQALKILNPGDYSALYQQRPAPPEGTYFTREMIRTFDRLPRRLRFYLLSDFATTEPHPGNTDPDYTVHLLVAVDDDGAAYILDVWRDRQMSDITVDAALDMYKAHRCQQWLGEKGPIENTLKPYIKRRMRERKVFARRTLYPSSADLEIRCTGIQGRMAQNMVFWRPGAEWLADVVAELTAFPKGSHDDIVACLALLGALLEKVGGRPPTPPGPAKMRTGDWNPLRG